MTDTIYAVSSGHPPAAIAVVRISGPMARAAATALAGHLPDPRRAGLRPLRDSGGTLLDRALVLVFPGPATATGEDLVELHCHGGRAVVAAIEAALAAHGLRRADPGEFTRRALANGRIDLAQAEGLADLLEAETEAQRVAALEAAEGRIGTLVAGWLATVATLSARVEVSLDFADEDDVADDPVVVDEVIASMAALARDLDAVLAAPSVERLRDGVRVVIAGPPNAGKSTLLNLLTERESAIVSPIAGTTRDRIEAPVARGGAAYVLVDTAGLTVSDDPIEAIGVDHARRAIATAGVVLWLGDDPPPKPDALWVQSRSDLPGRTALRPGRAVAVTRDDPASVAAVWEAIASRTASTLRTSVPILRERQRALCRTAAGALRDVQTRDPLLLAEHLRQTRRSLAAIVGVDQTEAMLDALFGRFCIGK